MWKFLTALGAEKKLLVGQLHSCRARNVVGQSFPDANIVTIATFEAEDWDTDNIHSTSVNPTRFTIPADLGGLWVFNSQVEFPNPATAHDVVMWVRKNGTTFIGGNSSDGNYGPANHVLGNVSVIDLAVPGDYYEFFVSQQSTAARTTLTMWASATLLMPYLAPPLFTPVRRVITGVIRDDGVIIAGSGFTCVRNSAGNYSITWSVPFTVAPIVIGQQGYEADWNREALFMNPAFTTRTFPTTIGMGVLTRTGGGTPSDQGFSFIATEVS